MNEKKKSMLRQGAPHIPDAERRLYRKTDDVAARIIQLLEERGLSQDELADAVGKHKSYVSRVLGGGVNLTLKTVAEFEAALDADILTAPVSRRPAPRRRRRHKTKIGLVPTASDDKPRQTAGVGVNDSGTLCFRGKTAYRIDTSGKPSSSVSKTQPAHELADAA